MMYYRDEEGHAIGVLTDFDLAARLDDEPDAISDRSRHGTVPFMSRELLSDEEDIKHTLTDDWESALYILTWIAMGYKNGQPPSESHDPLRKWREDLWASVAVDKRFFLVRRGSYETIRNDIRPEYSCLIQPIEKLRELVGLESILQRLKRCNVPVETELTCMTASVFFDVLKV
jgi:hypothetical protein